MTLDISFKSSDAFPSSWSNEYLISLEYAKFSSLDKEENLSGNKISASIGVKL